MAGRLMVVRDPPDTEVSDMTEARRMKIWMTLILLAVLAIAFMGFQIFVGSVRG